MLIREFAAVLGLALAGAATVVLVVHLGLKILKPQAFHETRPPDPNEGIATRLGAMASAAGLLGNGLASEEDRVGEQIQIGAGTASNANIAGMN
jgi:hypothetical protein